MKLLLCVLLSSSAVFGHVISMSTGDLTLHGTRARYELRMPAYEMVHVKNPDRQLFEQVRFVSAGQPGQLLSKTCRADESQGTYVCVAEYEFSSPVDRLDVECTLHSVTVPNHVHLLRAERGDRKDQAIFDFSFTKATLRFAPPTFWETAITQSGAGFIRALGGLVQVLFLASLVLAARSRRELLGLAVAFLAGQLISALVVPKTGWQPPARFVEAAAALTIAYLAVEILLLPDGGWRWLIAGVLGCFHGLYFELFLRKTDYSATYVLSGASLGEILLICLFALTFSRLERIVRAAKPVQVSASALFVIGMIWFFLRVKG